MKISEEIMRVAIRAEDEYEHPKGYRDHYARVETILEAVLPLIEKEIRAEIDADIRRMLSADLPSKSEDKT